MKLKLSWFALNPLLLRGGGRGWGEPMTLRNSHSSKREFLGVADHPTPQPPPLKRRGSAAALHLLAMCSLAACSPSAPTAPATPTRNVDYRVTTTPSTADRRFLVEFRSLTDRDLCISANDWPTAQGELGVNRPADAGDAVHRVQGHDALIAFVRFDQVPAESRQGDAVRSVDFAPVPIFCGSGLTQ